MNRTIDQVLSGRWWRATAYEIADGYVRPSAGARLEPFDLGATLEEAPERPYEVLSRIVGRGRYTVDQSLTSATQDDIVTWCRQYGLLGVLLQLVDAVIFPATTEPGLQDQEPWVTQTSFHRTIRGWQHQNRTGDAASAASWVQPPIVIRRSLTSAGVALEPISETWARFFPSIPVDARERDVYPHPMERAFWECYQEPVSDFLEAAHALTTALMTIAKGRETKTEASALDDYALAFDDLNGLAEPACWVVEPTNNGVEERWVTPTPLAALAMLALRDLRRGRQLRICANETCRNLFGSARYQSRYCSRRCRLTVNKRTLRRRQREKAARRASSTRGTSNRTRGMRVQDRGRKKG